MNYNVQRRLKNELKNENNITYFNIVNNFIKFSYKNMFIKVELDNNYPFRPPINIYINDKLTTICSNNNVVTNLLLEKYGSRCLYCESLMCNINWSPTCTIINVVEEILINKTKMNNIENLLLYKKYSNQFNNLPDNISSLIIQFI